MTVPGCPLVSPVNLQCDCRCYMRYQQLAEVAVAGRALRHSTSVTWFLQVSVVD